ncbi:hypothetical protein FN846DRAFT_785990 [Sphaerosporella brunnea]|uniref:DUF676 domain-containing protein n=1 Tax=Sphaerosporella brunnea TaxID=1250544 RepID=A0A5J5EHM5_9PEZI|nr:hypothetical protein FN846DRAFT_785990 [Sphaerosporella brunnea]
MSPWDWLRGRSTESHHPAPPNTPTPASKPSGDIVFRVTSIPHGTSLSDLHSALSDFPNLVPSCTTLCASADSPRRYLTALIHFFPSPPTILATLRRGDIYPVELSQGTSSHDIAIDRDFDGLTQLYEPGGTIKADIVAVCGLNGHPYGSWTAHPEKKGQRKMWLRHFLREDMPGCRTMIYGYDSSLSEETRGIHRIPDYSEGLLKALKNSRKSEEEKERALIFVGHHLGGIIISQVASQALVRAKESEKIYGSLFRCTRATIFFGTPHRGLSVDDILDMIGDHSSRVELVKSLQTGSQELAAELRRFKNYVADAKIKIVSFKESEQSLKLKKGPDGKWSRSGDPYTAVEAESALLQLPETMEETLSVAGDNSTMVKFKHKAHTTYKNVLEYLEEYAHPCPRLGISPLLFSPA